MKPEAQRTAIADACGWTSLRKEPFADELLCRWNELMGTDRNGKHDQHVPNYTGDLNAMHEAETVLKGQYWVAYFDLIQHTGKATGVRATAAQRAEAFLRTLNLWVEEEQEPCCQKCGEKLQTNRKHEGYLGYDILCGLCADDMRNRHE